MYIHVWNQIYSFVFNNNVLSGGYRQERTESNNNLLVNVVNFTKHCNKMQ